MPYCNNKVWSLLLFFCLELFYSIKSVSLFCFISISCAVCHIYVQCFTIGNDFMKLSWVFYTLFCWVMKKQQQQQPVHRKEQNFEPDKNGNARNEVVVRQCTGAFINNNNSKKRSETIKENSNMLDLWIFNLTKATISRTHCAAKRLFVVNLSLFDSMILILNLCVHIKDGGSTLCTLVSRTPIFHRRKFNTNDTTWQTCDLLYIPLYIRVSVFLPFLTCIKHIRRCFCHTPWNRRVTRVSLFYDIQFIGVVCQLLARYHVVIPWYSLCE